MEERLIKYLKDKVWIAKSKVLKISHSNIAKDLHSSRVVVSRLMKKLENNGFLKQSRNQVEVIEV
jgi:CRP/FNR family transcriptional regulator